MRYELRGVRERPEERVQYQRVEFPVEVLVSMTRGEVVCVPVIIPRERAQQ